MFEDYGRLASVRKETDLYTLSQTLDLKSLSPVESPLLWSFRCVTVVG